MKKGFATLALASVMLLAGCGSQGSAAAKYKAGTYTAAGEGKNGDVTVEVVFSDNKIESVEVKEHQETPAFAEKVIDTLPAAIVEKQSAEVDIVSGSTLTSNAILQAVADCIGQASAK